MNLSWDWSGQYARLAQVSDETTLLCRFTYGIFSTLTVWPGTPEERQIIFELIDSDSRLDVLRMQVSSAETLYWYFHYDLVGPQNAYYLTGIDYPTGKQDRVVYNQVEGFKFPNAAGKSWLPHVLSYTLSPGAGQPDIILYYDYTVHNFLGYNGNFGDWSADSDYIYTTLTDYTYGSTETVSDGDTIVTTTRIYNNYHLLLSEEVVRTGCRFRNDFTYYAEEGVFIDSQPSQFQLPKQQQTTWTDNTGNVRVETTLAEYDESGNPVREVSADGTETLTTWYSVEGDEGCPAEPHGFVRFMRSQKVIPAETGFDAPVYETLYTYGYLGEDEHIVQNTVAESADGQYLSYRQYNYINASGQAEYGRLTSIIDTKYDNAATFVSRQDFTTSVSDGIMHQTAILTGYDGLSMNSSRQQSVWSGLLVQETNAQGVTVTYSYDSCGRILTRTVAPGTLYENTTTWSYTITSSGPETTVTDASGNLMKILYDGAGRETVQQQRDSDNTGQLFTISSKGYNSLGEMDSGSGIDWETPSATQFHLGMNASRDGWGGVRDIAFTDGTQNRQDVNPVTLSRTVYMTGNTTTGTRSSGRTITQLDGRSQLPVADTRIKVSGAALADRHYEWDGAGRLRVETDERGNVTRRTYDAYNRVVTQTLSDGSVVTRTYAPHLTGNSVAAISVSGSDADGNRQTWLMGTQEFDSLGRLTKQLSGGRVTRFAYQGASPAPSVVTLPSGKTLQYSYIPELGNVVSSMTAEGVSKVFTYDPKTADLLNAREGETANTNVWTPSGTLKNETFSLDGVSRSAEHSFTLSGEAVLYRDISGKALRYGRDDFGRITTITDDALSAELKYDALGRMISQAVTDTASSSGMTTALEYDDFGRETLRTLTDSTGVTLSVSQTWLDNDLLATRTTRQSGAVIREEKYDYDNRNRLVSYTATGSSLVLDGYGQPMTGQVYQYDALNNLTVVVTSLGDGTTDAATYHYENGEDPTQLTRVTHTHAGYPQTINLAYDANGHMTLDEAGRTLVYDATGRLSSVSGEGISGGGYGYDAMNRLVSQNVSSVDTRHLYYRDDERVSEVLVQQDRDVRLVKAGSSYLGVSDGSSLNLIGSDHHGSLLWSREASEAEGRQHSWSPYGTGEPVDLLPGFNGNRADPVSGSYHLGNGYRAYNPVLMRFNCPDSLSPFGAGGINPYAYCAGDPVNFTDPSGHISAVGWTGIGLGIVGILGAAFTAGLSVVAASIGTALTAGITTGAAISATGAVSAAVSSASAVSLTVGVLGVVSDLAGIVAGATEDVNPEASSVLGWVSLTTGIAGVGAVAKSAVNAGRRGGAKLVQRNNINLHPQNASPTGYYKAFSIAKQRSGGYKVESWFSHNLTKDNESWLVVHGTQDGFLAYSDPIAKYEKNIPLLTNAFTPEEFAGHLLRKNIDLWELASTSQLNLVACFGGGKGRMAQRLANYIDKPVFGYGNNQYLRKRTGSVYDSTVYDDFLNVLQPNIYHPNRAGISRISRRRELISQA